jgi:protein translocase SecG subunit
MTTLLPYIQIGLAVVMVSLILMQQSEAGLGAVFGGSDGGTINRTKRGPEKTIFQICIVVSVLFVASVFLTTVIN